MIVVTTPTGDIGGRVLQHLARTPEEVRVIARAPSKLPASLHRRLDIVAGSHADADVIGRALEGATRVFWLAPGSPVAPSAHAAYVGFSDAFCAALPGSGVTHVVGISALGRGWGKPAGLVTASLAMDDAIAATGVHYRALACASLMDNLLRQVEAIRESGLFYAPTPGDLLLPHVAKDDVARIASDLLLETDWQGVAEVPLHGPEDLSFDAMAETMSSVLGRPIGFREMPMDAFAAMMRQSGASDGMTRAYVEMFSAKNDGLDAMTTPAGRASMTPTTFRRWCEAELRPVVAD